MTLNSNDLGASSPQSRLPTLSEIFSQHKGRFVAKIDTFFDVYEKHLSPYRGKTIRLLEIGVDKGGSLEIWRKYFGADSQIHGVDIKPSILKRIRGKTHIHIGSQADSEFLLKLVANHGPFDVIIDDGSHHFEHQIISFETLYPTMADQGVYICEDSFTSYWKEYDGGVGRDTFIEYAKRLVDELHAFWAVDDSMEVTPFTKSTRGVHFYSGTVVFERCPIDEPKYIGRGRMHKREVSMHELKKFAEKEAKK